jgi:hypothetical protein
MKKLTLLLCLFLLTEGLEAQNSNLIVYNNEGHKFYVILNGIRQNIDPETNVKITQLEQPYYKLKIIFDDERLPSLDKNIALEPNTETVAAIIQNRKGDYTLRWQSSVPIAEAPAPATNQKTYSYTNTTPTATTTTTQVNTTTQQNKDNININANEDNVKVNVNVDGYGLNININADDANAQSTTTSTTTTTTYSSVQDNNVVYVEEESPRKGGCPVPITYSEFQRLKTSVESKTFEDSKLTVAKQFIASNCLYARQVKELMELFTYEDSKLTIAKYAYTYTHDPQNYYLLNDAFTFESSIEELDNFLKTKR